ncbi:MAG TPA: hypothetical protein VEF89_09880 [Solirubrobacteraceae bacterium]|nr:hypothetical protein [Solirubrobacteraceae bacterium]
MSTTIEDLVQAIDGRIRGLKGEIASLEDALTALSSNGSPAPAPRPRAKQTRKRASRPAKAVPAETVERLLFGSDGLTTAALAKQSNGDPADVLRRLRELEATGRVRRTGERRGTRWHVMTDEDRIQKRAAELASRSRRPERP